MRSLRDSRSEPYTVDQQHLRGWTLALEPASTPNEPLLVLRPAAALPQDLFRQVFARTMESYTALAGSAMPIVLRGEYRQGVGDQMTLNQLLAAARTAGLGQASMVPRCLVHRRTACLEAYSRCIWRCSTLQMWPAFDSSSVWMLGASRQSCSSRAQTRISTDGSRCESMRQPNAWRRSTSPTRMGLYDIPVTTLDGRVITLEGYRGQALLIVNVASRCGFTPQYRGLEECPDVIGIGLSCSDFRAISSVDRSQGTKQTSGSSAQSSTTSRSRCSPRSTSMVRRAPALSVSQVRKEGLAGARIDCVELHQVPREQGRRSPAAIRPSDEPRAHRTRPRISDLRPVGRVR